MKNKDKTKQTLLICGTNAGRPSCRYYDISYDPDIGLISYPYIDDGKHEQSGSEIISSNPKLTLNSYYSKDSKHLYIAKEMDENNAQLLRVGFGMKKQSGSEYLKNAENAFSAFGPVKFIRMFEHGDKIFIFFRETLEGGREVSRVATICSNDNGGSQNILTNKFTTFVKTTIECEVSKQFSFSQLTSVSKPIEVDGEVSIFGTFRTDESFIPGSSVCGFKLSEIERSLSSKYTNGDQANPLATCKNIESQEELQYISNYIPEVCIKPLPIDSEPLLTRTTFKTADSRDLMNSIEVMKGNKNFAIIVIGTTNSKILRASLQLQKNPGELVHRKRLEFLTEEFIHPKEHCKSADGIYALAIDEAKKTIIASGTSCLMTTNSGNMCRKFTCGIACSSSGDPNCRYKNGECIADNRDEMAQTHQIFQPCPKPSPKPTTTQPTTRQRSPYRPIIPEIVPEEPGIHETLGLTQEEDDVVIQKSAMNMIIIGCVALIVGLLVGAAIGVFCFKWSCRGYIQKDPNQGYIDGSKVQITSPSVPMRHAEKERHYSVYENAGRIDSTRIDSTGSDSSRDSGIRMSGDSTEVKTTSRGDHEYHAAIHANTTGRIRPKKLDLSGTNAQNHYQTMGNKQYSEATFGTMKYATTSRGASVTSEPKSGPKLGLSSLYNNKNYGNYATIQPSRSKQYMRQQSMPSTYQPSTNKPIMTVRPMTDQPPSSPIRNQHYPILAKHSANMYNDNFKPEQSWRSYKHDDVGHYATLPKGHKRPQIKRTPSSTNNGTLGFTKPKLVHVCPPTVDASLPASNMFAQQQ